MCHHLTFKSCPLSCGAGHVTNTTPVLYPLATSAALCFCFFFLLFYLEQRRGQCAHIPQHGCGGRRTTIEVSALLPPCGLLGSNRLSGLTVDAITHSPTTPLLPSYPFSPSFLLFEDRFHVTQAGPKLTVSQRMTLNFVLKCTSLV